MSKNKVGRPKMPDREKQRHARPAIYPDVYKKAKKLAKHDGIYLTEWFKKTIEEKYSQIFPDK